MDNILCHPVPRNSNSQRPPGQQRPAVCPVPVFGEQAHGLDRGNELHLAQGPTGRVQALLWQFDGHQTLAGQGLQRGVHGAAHQRRARLWLVHKREVLRGDTNKNGLSKIFERSAGLLRQTIIGA